MKIEETHLEGAARGRCRYGEMRWDTETSAVARSLATYGEWAQHEIDFLSRFLAPDATALVLGAGVGVHALAFARRLGPAGRVHAVESRPAALALLRENVGRNGLDEAVVIGNDDGVAARADLVWIGTDASDDVLSEISDTLAAGRAVVAVAVRRLAPAWTAAQRLRQAGYGCHLCRFPAFNPENFTGDQNNVFGDDATFVLVGLPAGVSLPPAPAAVRVTAVADLDTLAFALMVNDEQRRAQDLELRLRAEVEAGRHDIAGLRNEVARQARLNSRARSELIHLLGGKRLWMYLLAIFSGTLRNWRAVKKSKLFDVEWYRRMYPDVAASPIDPLLHYLLFGADEGRQPNAFFDSAWYIGAYGDIAESGENPLVHYIYHGARERRAAGPRFDTNFYLRTYPDVAASKLNPLRHYLRHGLREKRAAMPTRDLAPAPAAPPPEAWDALAEGLAGAARPAPVVDVVVPVYRGFDDTLACIHSVLDAPTAVAFELVVIDDASPEPELSAALRTLAGKGLFTLLVNEHNLGFVGTVNRGMALHGDRDVVLLNSDTVVYGDWLDRIRAQAQVADVASVTPLSNNATICSYPKTNSNNIENLEIAYEELDRLCATLNPGVAVDIPTAVGFCMYIRRDCLDLIGTFDEAFLRGYGEENDFCRRAVARGLRNVLAMDVFVRHTGEVSFAETATASQQIGLKILGKKHPDYFDVVRAHLAADPALAARRRLDAARLGAWVGGKALLYVSHNWGGGIERHIADMAAELDVGIIVMTPSRRDDVLVDLNALSPIHTPNLVQMKLDAQMDELAELLPLAGVFHIHVHSFAGWSLRAPTLLSRLAGKMGVPYDFTFHDYMPLCPRINMIDGSGVYCGERGVQACRRCIGVNGSRSGMVDIEEWRGTYATFLDGARRLFAPSADTAGRAGTYLPGREILVRPHPEPPAPATAAAVPWHQGERLRVAVIGAIGPHKGSQLLLEMARDAEARGLEIDYVIVGYTNMDAKFRQQSNVSVTGRYDEAGVFDILASQACHLALIPSLWPETYCYTLSIALMAGFPVATFAFGAPGDRLRALDPDGAVLLPLEAMADPGLVNDLLLEAAPRIESRMPLPLQAGTARYTFNRYYMDDMA